MKDYYKVFELTRDCSDSDIKKKYRELAKKFHPDRNSEEGAEEKFKEISEAYEHLNPKKRKEYTQGLESYERGGQGMGFGDIFNGFGFGQQQQKFGSNVEVGIQLRLEDIFSGTTKEIEYTRDDHCNTCAGEGGKREKCPVCDGIGSISRAFRTPNGNMRVNALCQSCSGVGTKVVDPCHTCHGSGEVPLKQKMMVNIPPGIPNGAALRVDGKGNGAGDLYIFVREIDHESFKREGANLHIDVNVSYPDLILGKDVTIKGLDGKDLVFTVPPLTDLYKKFRLKSKGMIVKQVIGDILVGLKLIVPKEITDEQKELILKLND